ncbi:MAG: sialidase family protein [Planctomycetota bacterium]|jgi:hypothetical protein
MKARYATVFAVISFAAVVVSLKAVGERPVIEGFGTTLPPRQSDVPRNEPKAGTFAAGQIGTNVNVSNLIGNEAEVTVDINPMDPNNLVVVGHSPLATTMNTFYTTDGGESWTLVALDDADDGLPSDHRFDPTVAYDENGNVYVGYGALWEDESEVEHSTVVVCRSANGGMSYPQCTYVASSDTSLHDKWHLATGPDPVTATQQNVYIAWTNNVSDGGIHDQHLLVSKSTDGGGSFTTPIVINDNAITGIDKAVGADPAVGPNGELYICWSNWDTGELFLDASFDGGSTWGTDVLVVDTGVRLFDEIPAQPDRGIPVGHTIDTDRSGGLFTGRLYLVYTDLGAGGLPNTDVFVQTSDDGGNTWTGAIVVNDDGGTNSQFLSWLDVDQVSGWVSVVWYDARNDPNNKRVEVFGATSSDGGSSFHSNVRVSNGQSDQSQDNPQRYLGNYLEYIGVVSFDRTGHAVWADNSTDPADLDFFFDRFYALRVECGTCDETTMKVRAQRTFRNNCPQTAVADGLEFTMYTIEIGNSVLGAIVRNGAPFTAGQCDVSGDNTSVDVTLSGGQVLIGDSVTVEGTLCQDTENEFFWRDIRFTVQGATVCEVPPHGFSVHQPQPLGGGLFEHVIEIVNESPTVSLQLKNLEAIADFDFVSNLNSVSFSGPTHQILVGAFPDTILSAQSAMYSYQTSGSFLGGHVYFTYEISNVENPTGPSDWDRTIADHPIGAAGTGVAAGPAYEVLLGTNYPNPFNGQTTIRYGVREHGHVSLNIYDVTGRLVRTLVDQVQAPKTEGYQVTWEGRDDNGEFVASGVYFYSLKTGGFTQTKKMVYLK